jgi:hypothetical protein
MNSGENVMKKMLCLAVIATAFVGAPAYAKSQVSLSQPTSSPAKAVLSGCSMVAALVVNTSVTTGKGGVLGAVLGKGGALGGLLGGGCGCGH